MIMKLPNKFNMRGVEVKDSILKIYKRDRFEDLMYELTYATKHCWKCVYCGKKLNKKKFDSFYDQIIFVIDYVIDELTKNKLLLKFISKNLSFGLYSEKINKLIGENSIGVKEIFLKGMEENNIKLENPEVTLFMIIELTSSTCFSSNALTSSPNARTSS